MKLPILIAICCTVVASCKAPRSGQSDLVNVGSNDAQFLIDMCQRINVIEDQTLNRAFREVLLRTARSLAIDEGRNLNWFDDQLNSTREDVWVGLCFRLKNAIGSADFQRVNYSTLHKGDINLDVRAMSDREVSDKIDEKKTGVIRKSYNGPPTAAELKNFTKEEHAKMRSIDAKVRKDLKSDKSITRIKDPQKRQQRYNEVAELRYVQGWTEFWSWKRNKDREVSKDAQGDFVSIMNECRVRHNKISIAAGGGNGMNYYFDDHFIKLHDLDLHMIVRVLEHFDIKSLKVCFNNFTDLAPLTRLKSLERLYIGGNYITDVSPLLELPKLTYVNLADNYIADIAPLFDHPVAHPSGKLTLNVKDNCISQARKSLYEKKFTSKYRERIYVEGLGLKGYWKLNDKYTQVERCNMSRHRRDVAGFNNLMRSRYVKAIPYVKEHFSPHRNVRVGSLNGRDFHISNEPMPYQDAKSYCDTLNNTHPSPLLYGAYKWRLASSKLFCSDDATKALGSTIQDVITSNQMNNPPGNGQALLQGIPTGVTGSCAEASKSQTYYPICTKCQLVGTSSDLPPHCK